MPINSSVRLPIIKVTDNKDADTTDFLAIEEPLEIRLESGIRENRKTQNVSVTMRTPGNDAELALGFLFTEGIIKRQTDIGRVEHCFFACAENKENVILVSLKESAEPNLNGAERNFIPPQAVVFAERLPLVPLRPLIPSRVALQIIKLPLICSIS